MPPTPVWKPGIRFSRQTSFDLKPNIELFVRLENILDASYEMIYGYGALGFSAQAGAKLSL